MTMHLAQGLTTISTKKRKVKITKAKMAQYEVQWRKHNKWAKQNNMHDLRYDTVEQYIDYCHGKTPKKDLRADRSTFVVRKSIAQQQIEEHNKKYPSLPMSSTGPHDCGKQEPLMYTGDLIEGIATMHKSNAVPVMKGTDQAKDIARMRRG